MAKATKDILAAFGKDKANIIPILQAIQKEQGFISPEAVEETAKYVGVSKNNIYGVASFYAQFRFTKPGKHCVKVCLGTACHVRGGENILENIEDHLHVKRNETTPDYKFSLERVACFGCCALAPVMVVDDKVYASMTPAKAKDVISKYEKGDA